MFFLLAFSSLLRRLSLFGNLSTYSRTDVTDNPSYSPPPAGSLSVKPIPLTRSKEQVVGATQYLTFLLSRPCQVCGNAAYLRLVRIFTTKTYERAVRKLMSEADRQKMEAAIVADPGRAPVLRGTGGIRKLRWAGSGRGKRGGIRTIYFHHAGPPTVTT